MNLQELIKEALAFGSAACAEGKHEWTFDGGRCCPKDHDHCSQAVYVCSSCGEYDYGGKDGPAWKECFVDCSMPDLNRSPATHAEGLPT
jgi:hypothetical protein